MTTWIDRAALAADDWITEVAIDRNGVTDGRVHVGLWARTWLWAGRVEDVTLHLHDLVEPDPEAAADALRRMSPILAEVCADARARFTDAAPRQVSCRNGPFPPRLEPRVGARITDHPRIRRESYGVDVPFETDGSWLAAACAATANPAIRFFDRVDPHARPMTASDPGPRTWRYVAMASARRAIGGRRQASAWSLDEEDAGGIAALSIGMALRSAPRPWIEDSPSP